MTIDLRHHFRDPHVSPELRYMTADDEPVRTAVLHTPGITDLVDATGTAVAAFASGPSAGAVTVADGCAGGQHRTVDRTTGGHAGSERIPRLSSPTDTACATAATEDSRKPTCNTSSRPSP
ncbi:hypothetical protein [Streptomyces sp. T12]|uniref:RapZ C-terminal domain-containing protein n=1 Tax=Streptomyces sp. T12 TaxID=477697 RepID=UPI0035A37DFC